MHGHIITQNGILFNDERDARVNTCSVTIDVRGKMKKCSTSGMLSLNALDTNCLLRYNIHIDSGSVDNDPVQRLFGFERRIGFWFIPRGV